MVAEARQQAFQAVQIAHRHLLTAMKHLAGQRLPLSGLNYDLGGAIQELRVVHERTAEAIRSIEPHVPKA